MWNTHTKDCVVCQNALTKINRLTVLSYVGALVCLLIGIVIDGRAVALKMATTVDSMNISLFQVIPPTGFWSAISEAGTA